ncbi:hypothetical protein GJ496_010848 [Pomphorhynchus laevis]|nr:hypothetical protein GJ496_010848 [Pomphorhynchus laevis]
MIRYCASGFSSCCLTDSKAWINIDWRAFAWLSGIVDRLIRLPQSLVQPIQSVGLSGVFDLPVRLLKSIFLSIRCVRLFDTVDLFVRLAKSVIKSIQVVWFIGHNSSEFPIRSSQQLFIKRASMRVV